MTGALVKAEDAPKIQKEVVSGVQILDDVAHQHLRAGEDQMPLKLIDVDAGPELMEGLAFERGTDATGVEFGSCESETNKGVPWVWEVEEMQVEAARKFVADADATHAIAMRIKRRRKDAYAQLPRQDRDNTAGHAAFGRHADLVNPFTGVVVHAARTHYA